jgi:hypothetical protein
VYHDYGGKVRVLSDILPFISPRNSCKDRIVTVNFAAYFDASGKNTGYKFLSVGGASSTQEKWKKFEIEWLAILNREGVTEFHATDFACCEGEYKNWKGDKGRRSHFLRDLIAVAKKYTHKLFTVTVEMVEWQAANELYPIEEHFHSPYALASFASANLTIKWAKKRKVENSNIEIIFEEGDEGWGDLTGLCKKYLFVEPVRLPKAKACAFQLGDMLAWKTRITAQNLYPSLRQIERRAPGSEIELRRMIKEIRSLDRLMFRPAEEGIFTRKNLINNCKALNIPERPSSNR